MLNLSVMRIEWVFEKLNLEIANCSLTMSSIEVRRNFGFIQDNQGIMAHIDSCQLGYFKAFDFTSILIENSFTSVQIQTQNQINSSVFVVSNSNITFQNSSFKNVTSVQPIILDAFNNSNVTIENCSFSENNGTVGLIHVTDKSALNIKSCDVNNNMIHNVSYAAIYVINSLIVMDNCTLRNNHGRALRLLNTSDFSYVGKSLFEGNKLMSNRKVDGAGIWITLTTDLTIESCDFFGNEAVCGGAVSLGGPAMVSFISCQFLKNEAANFGGAIVWGTCNIENCSFIGNKAGYGGAIFTENNNMSAINSLFQENTAIIAAGANLDGGNHYFKACNFYNNTATYEVGAIFCLEGCVFDHF